VVRLPGGRHRGETSAVLSGGTVTLVGGGDVLFEAVVVGGGAAPDAGESNPAEGPYTTGRHVMRRQCTTV